MRDLFYATPARLKFLKTDRTEAEAIRDVVRRLAMSRPDVAFTVAGEERAPVTWVAALPDAPGRLKRLGDVLGADFRANAIEVRGGRDGLWLEGFAGLPTYSKGNALGLYLFVNGRPVRDKLMLGAVRAAYADYLPRDRHPVVALFVTVDPREVDVNVHPAKTEVRFRDAGLMRALIVRALQEALTARQRAHGLDRRRRHHRGVPPQSAAARRVGLADVAGAAVPATQARASPPRSPARPRALPRRRRRRSRSAGRRRTPACTNSRPSPTPSTGRSAPRAPRSTRPTSWRRPATAW